jgi:hypothetical protein
MRSLLSGEERDRFNSNCLGNVAVLIGVVALYLSDKAEVQFVAEDAGRIG